MILFLTSSPDGDLFSDNGGSPNGFDNRNHFADFLRENIKEPVFFTTFAASPDSFERNDWGAEYFAGVCERTGIQLTGHAVCDNRNPEEAKALVEKSGLIMLSGGHVPTQNAFFEKLGLRELMKDYKGVVIGVSAGTMNSADIVYAQPEEPGEATDPDYKKFIPGLGLTRLQILPHYNLVKDSYIDGMKLFEEVTAKDSFGHNFTVLRDGSFVLVKDGESYVYGEAYSFADGVLRQICEKDQKLKLA